MEPHEYETMAQVEDTHWWYVGMRRITTVLLHTIPTPTRVIDAGCGTGGNLRTLRPAPAGHGFDQHPLAVAVAAERGSSVVRADIQAIPFNSASADLVTCFDVLYHRAVGDDAAALRELARVVKPGGYVLLRLPAHAWLNTQHDTAVHTQRRYEPAQVRALCSHAGLDIETIFYVNGILLPVLLLRRLLQRRHPVAQGSALRRPPALVQWVGLTALTLEAALLRVGITLPYGVSLMCLARRPAHPIETE